MSLHAPRKGGRDSEQRPAFTATAPGGPANYSMLSSLVAPATTLPRFERLSASRAQRESYPLVVAPVRPCLRAGLAISCSLSFFSRSNSAIHSSRE